MKRRGGMEGMMGNDLKMLYGVDYTDTEEGVQILRCPGEGPVLEVPSCLDGKPVISLGDHALAGTNLEEVWLPEGLRMIGDYAFYGCRKLRRISFPSTLTRLGRGVFVAVNHLEELVFREEAGGGTHRCMKEILEDLSYELEAVVCGSDGQERFRLLFPGYYEDSVENTPARIIQVTFEGTGYKYRQCFREGNLDLDQYDSLFYLASVQELPETVYRLAFDRLTGSYCMSRKAKEEYLGWLGQDIRRTAEHVLQAGREEELDLLCRENWFNEERLDLFLSVAGQRGLAWAVSALMEIRRRERAAKRGGQHKYEL